MYPIVRFSVCGLCERPQLARGVPLRIVRNHEGLEVAKVRKGLLGQGCGAGPSPSTPRGRVAQGHDRRACGHARRWGRPFPSRASFTARSLSTLRQIRRSSRASYRRCCGRRCPSPGPGACLRPRLAQRPRAPLRSTAPSLPATGRFYGLDLPFACRHSVDVETPHSSYSRAACA